MRPAHLACRLLPCSPMASAREMAARDWDRVAEDYFAEVVSPLSRGVPRPLLRALDRIASPRRKTAGDLGCGTGTLLPTLAARFGRVIGVDFSPAMLARARASCRAGHVRLLRADLADLRRLHGVLDVAVTVNAVLTPDAARCARILGELRATLKPRGVFLGIFPAMEPVLYQAVLIHDRERRGRPPAAACRRADAILERDRYDFVHGTYTEDGATQKFFYGFELVWRLKQAGFRHVRLGRVAYRWSDVGGYERFPGAPPMWDWFVRAAAPA